MLRNRTRGERTAEVVLGGPKLYGALMRDGLTFYRADLIVVDPVEAGVEVWRSSCLGTEPDLT